MNCIEPLETRIAPATLFAVDSTNHLLRFDSATPGTIDATLTITGIDLASFVRGIDFRPATGELFAFTVPGGTVANATIKTYTLDPLTGAATLVGTIAATLVGTIAGTVPGAGDYPGGFGFNPSADRLRVVQTDNENFRINPFNGSLSGDDANLTYTPPATGPIIAEAYDRNFDGTPLTTLFGIDRGSSALVVQGGIDGSAPNGPNGGVISSIGGLGLTLSATAGAGSYSGNLFVEHSARSVRIGGDLIGGAGKSSGLIVSDYGHYGRISIGGDIIGGPGFRSGGIAFDSYLGYDASAGRITVGGDVRGGGAGYAGSITSAAGLGVVHIRGDLVGGSGSNTGEVSADHSAALLIDGSILGGSGKYAQGTGGAFFLRTLGALRVGHDLLGGNLHPGDASLASSGFVIAAHIGSLFIGGDVRAGQDDSKDGALLQNAEIISYSSIGPVTIRGDFSGSVGRGGDVTHAEIVALGQHRIPSGSTRDVAIESIEIGGDLRLAQIFGGFAGNQEPALAYDADAQIGHVTVGGDWIASDLLTGVATPQANGTHYEPITGPYVINHPGVIATIGEITIKGRMRSDPAAPGLNFGIAAQAILGFSLSGHRERFTSAYDPVIFPPVASGQAAVVEVHG